MRWQKLLNYWRRKKGIDAKEEELAIVTLCENLEELDHTRWNINAV